MFGTGTWAGVETGLDDVDLWVGGLAEVTNLFGGLLGSTFNYVFQTQLEKLQDGDRFYYLNRTPGMNLRPQLEGNSFSELIMRNTDGTSTLKADAFAHCRLQVPVGATWSAAALSVADDPNTEMQREPVADSVTRRDDLLQAAQHRRPGRDQRSVGVQRRPWC